MIQNIYIMRHGQTLFNLRKKIQGWSDSPLTELGIAQAKEVGNHLNEMGLSFDAAYASTSERASDTLEYVLGNDFPYKRIKDLKEWNFGLFEGESEDLNPIFPYGDFYYKYGGEKELDFRNRFATAVKNIAVNDSSKNIFIVAHAGALIQFFKEHETDSEIEKLTRPIQNCSVFHYQCKAEKFILKEIINHDFSKLKEQHKTPTDYKIK